MRRPCSLLEQYEKGRHCIPALHSKLQDTIHNMIDDAYKWILRTGAQETKNSTVKNLRYMPEPKSDGFLKKMGS